MDKLKDKYWFYIFIGLIYFIFSILIYLFIGMNLITCLIPVIDLIYQNYLSITSIVLLIIAGINIKNIYKNYSNEKINFKYCKPYHIEIFINICMIILLSFHLLLLKFIIFGNNFGINTVPELVIISFGVEYFIKKLYFN